jgi:hypothetical protein
MKDALHSSVRGSRYRYVKKCNIGVNNSFPNSSERIWQLVQKLLQTGLHHFLLTHIRIIRVCGPEAVMVDRRNISLPRGHVPCEQPKSCLKWHYIYQQITLPIISTSSSSSYATSERLVAALENQTKPVAQEPEGSSPHSQQPATGPSPEPVESNPHPQANLPTIHSDPIFPPTPRSSKWSLSFRLSHQNLVHSSLLSHACHMIRESDVWYKSILLYKIFIKRRIDFKFT